MAETDLQQRLREYLNEAFLGFANDPPSSEFQKGYLSALIEIGKQFSSLSHYKRFENI